MLVLEQKIKAEKKQILMDKNQKELGAEKKLALDSVEKAEPNEKVFADKTTSDLKVDVSIMDINSFVNDVSLKPTGDADNTKEDEKLSQLIKEQEKLLKQEQELMKEEEELNEMIKEELKKDLDVDGKIESNKRTTYDIDGKRSDLSKMKSYLSEDETQPDNTVTGKAYLSF